MREQKQELFPSTAKTDRSSDLTLTSIIFLVCTLPLISQHTAAVTDAFWIQPERPPSRLVLFPSFMSFFVLVNKREEITASRLFPGCVFCQRGGAGESRSSPKSRKIWSKIQFKTISVEPKLPGPIRADFLTEICLSSQSGAGQVFPWHFLSLVTQKMSVKWKKRLHSFTFLQQKRHYSSTAMLKDGFSSFLCTRCSGSRSIQSHPHAVWSAPPGDQLWGEGNWSGSTRQEPSFIYLFFFLQQDCNLVQQLDASNFNSGSTKIGNPSLASFAGQEAGGTKGG